MFVVIIQTHKPTRRIQVRFVAIVMLIVQGFPEGILYAVL
jgi:hypothetical protein